MYFSLPFLRALIPGCAGEHFVDLCYILNGSLVVSRSISILALILELGSSVGVVVPLRSMPINVSLFDEALLCDLPGIPSYNRANPSSNLCLFVD